jgi:hypothetical protein
VQIDEQRETEEQTAYNETAREFDEKKINETSLELLDDMIETVPDSPERPSTLPRRKRTHILVSRILIRPATSVRLL